MSKRIISFLLCALLALSAAGCGKDKPVSGNKKPGNTSSVGSDISSSEPDNTEETDSTDSKPDNSAVKTNTEIGDPAAGCFGEQFQKLQLYGYSPEKLHHRGR